MAPPPITAAVAERVLAFVPPGGTETERGALRRLAWVGRAWRDGFAALVPALPGVRLGRRVRHTWVLTVADEGFGGDVGAALDWAVGSAGLFGSGVACELAAGLGAVGALDRFSVVPCGAARELLRVAAQRDRPAVLDRLALPPFCADAADARAVAALALACRFGSVGVLDRLALPPFSMGHDDAVDEACLTVAARMGHVVVLDRLAAEPYGLGHEDARARDCEALRVAARSDHVAVMDRLALPPYRMGRAEATLVPIDCALSRAVVRRLACRPFLRAVPSAVWRPAGVAM